MNVIHGFLMKKLLLVMSRDHRFQLLLPRTERVRRSSPSRSTKSMEGMQVLQIHVLSYVWEAGNERGSKWQVQVSLENKVCSEKSLDTDQRKVLFLLSVSSKNRMTSEDSSTWHTMLLNSSGTKLEVKTQREKEEEIKDTVPSSQQTRNNVLSTTKYSKSAQIKSREFFAEKRMGGNHRIDYRRSLSLTRIM